MPIHNEFKDEFKTIAEAKELLDNPDATAYFAYKELAKAYQKAFASGEALHKASTKLFTTLVDEFVSATNELLQPMISIQFQLTILQDERAYIKFAKQIAEQASNKIREINHHLDANFQTEAGGDQAYFDLQALINEMQENIDRGLRIGHAKSQLSNRFAYLPPGYSLSLKTYDGPHAYSPPPINYNAPPAVCHNFSDSATQLNQNYLPPPFSFGVDHFTQSHVAIGVGGFLLGGIVLRPLAKSLYNASYRTGRTLVGAANYAYGGIQQGLRFFLNPANYQAVPNVDIDLAEIVIDPQEDPITASNNALIQRIDALVKDQPKRELLSEEEIETYKKIMGLPDLENYIASTECALLHVPVVNPITIDGSYVVQEGQPGGRYWITTVDADALKQFINQCTINKKLAFAPMSPSDPLNADEVTLKNGFSYKNNEKDLLSYAAAIKEKISFWKNDAPYEEEGVADRPRLMS